MTSNYSMVPQSPCALSVPHAFQLLLHSILIWRKITELQTHHWSIVGGHMRYLEILSFHCFGCVSVCVARSPYATLFHRPPPHIISKFKGFSHQHEPSSCFIYFFHFLHLGSRHLMKKYISQQINISWCHERGLCRAYEYIYNFYICIASHRIKFRIT